MDNKHLGDNLDFSKRVILGLLQNKGFKVLVSPLQWDQWFDHKLYAKIIDVKVDSILPRSTGLLFCGKSERETYLQELIKEVNKAKKPTVLFLDPDKGLRKKDKRQKFVLPEEVKKLLTGNSKLVVAIYHHYRNTGGLNFEEALRMVRVSGQSNAFYYNLTFAAMIFTGKSANQLKDVKKVLVANLNPEKIHPRSKAKKSTYQSRY